MAHRVLILLALFAGAVLAVEGLPEMNAPVTLAVEADRPLPPEAMAEMRREFDRLVEGSGRRFDWRMRDTMRLGDTVAELVLVKFRGECRMEAPPAPAERGPMAITHTSDGEILPFSEVSCDRVRRVARSAMTGSDLVRGDMLMGRALARVVAHEVYHIVSHVEKHSSEGLFQRALSGAQLITDCFRFSRKDLERLHTIVR